MFKKMCAAVLCIALGVMSFTAMAAAKDDGKTASKTTGKTTVAAEKTAGKTAEKTTEKSAEPEEKTYGFTYNKNRYEIGMDGKTALKTLGKATSSRDVNTCANGYVNKAYTYGKTKDVEVYIEQDASKTKDVVASITLLTKNVATEEGLKVGDGIAQITKAYPSAVKGLGSYKVNDGKTELYIKVKDSKVSYIAYTVYVAKDSEAKKK